MDWIIPLIIGMLIGSFYQKQYKKRLWDGMEDHIKFLNKQVDEKNKEIYNLVKFHSKKDGP